MSKRYKYCIVPKCKSTTIKTPNKDFLALPTDKKMRRKWLIAMNRDDMKNPVYTATSIRFVCEDHFDVLEINYYINCLLFKINSKSMIIFIGFI